MVEKWQEIEKLASQIILDKQLAIHMILTSILSRGHILIEDVPGVGKTTLVQTIAKLLGFEATRIQFTSDLLPSDIIGSSIFNSQKNTFEFIRGPLFANLVLADELNRTNPRTQSALLQAMEEGRVTVERETYALPEHFLIIATQNPRLQTGTFPLPESQLDRFQISLSLGFSKPEFEVALLQGLDPRKKIQELKPVMNEHQLQESQNTVEKIAVETKVAQYVTELLNWTRNNPQDFIPLSTRAGLALIRCAKAQAFLQRRSFVLPEDVKRTLPYVFAHRLGGAEGIAFGENKAHELLSKVNFSF